MGSMRFVRDNFVAGSILNEYEFDSSPKYSVSLGLGTDPASFELREISSDHKRTIYEVWTAPFPTSTDPRPARRLRGLLYWETFEERMSRMG